MDAAFEHDKSAIARTLRQRLAASLAERDISRAAFSRQSGVDRATLTQLLNSDEPRLPRADTIAMLAATLNVSIDWLLGLSQMREQGAEIIEQAVQLPNDEDLPLEETVMQWHEDAFGYKIRHVPVTLPHLLKTDAVMAQEYAHSTAYGYDQLDQMRVNLLAYCRKPGTEMELCLSRQTLENFTHAADIWAGLSPKHRRDQLTQMIALYDELYPRFRCFIYDAAKRCQITSQTLFGPQRAVVYIGNLYFIYTSTRHVHALINHFDESVRMATVQPHAFQDYLRECRAAIT